MRREMERLYQSPLFQRAASYIEQDAAHTVEQQVELTQIPAFSNQERQKALRFRELMEAEGYSAEMDEVCNVFTRIPGTGEGPTLYVTAHLDTVFPMDTDLQVRREGSKTFCPGIADDTRGCAEILALLRALRESAIRPVGDLLIGANVGEEGLGNLRGMRQFFQSRAQEVDGFFSIDGAGEDITYGGTGSLRYKVTFRGPGGHSYGDFGCVNPIHAMGRAIAKIGELRTPRTPKTTFNVGVVEGGTSVNAIAYECSMLVDMRSEEADALEKLHQEVVRCVEQAAEEENQRWVQERDWLEDNPGRTYDPDARIQVEWEQVGNRPCGSQPLESPLVQTVLEAYRALGTEPGLTAHSSTDANLPLSLGIPACTLGGGGTCGGCHSLEEWYDAAGAPLGTQRLLLAILACVGVTGVSQPLLPKRERQ